jgi:hypothetical protein
MDRTQTDATADIWTPHLRPGERLVWSSAVAEDLYLAALGRRRKIRLFIMLVAGAAAIVFGMNFIDALFRKPAATSSFHFLPVIELSGLAMAPLYLAFCLTCAVVAIAQVSRFSLPRPAAALFAVTSDRLIALGTDGALVDEMPGAEVDGVLAGGRSKTPDIYVLRKDDEKEERVFAIEYIERPLEAKAVIEGQFLEQGS